jgi:hypothetical protein
MNVKCLAIHLCIVLLSILIFLYFMTVYIHTLHLMMWIGILIWNSSRWNCRFNEECVKINWGTFCKVSSARSAKPDKCKCSAHTSMTKTSNLPKFRRCQRRFTIGCNLDLSNGDLERESSHANAMPQACFTLAWHWARDFHFNCHSFRRHYLHHAQVHVRGRQMACFQTKNPNLGKF